MKPDTTTCFFSERDGVEHVVFVSMVAPGYGVLITQCDITRKSYFFFLPYDKTCERVNELIILCSIAIIKTV